jgi:exopolyphosphatase / guanosine-5'-triphosphate,3'-diphosphate pyrophosphatase
VRRLRRAVRDELKRHMPAREWRGAQLIGSGGTFTNLAGMVLARQGMVATPNVHGTRVSRADLEHLLLAVQETPLAERRTIPGLNPDRADIIVAGLAVVAEVMARLDAHALSVSSYGIREGLLLETARVRPVAAVPGEARQRSVRQLAERCRFEEAHALHVQRLALAERCRFEEAHALHVQRLALQLFDSLGARLGCEPGDRQTLADAALLHDIGYYINYEQHHKHSYYLVLHADLLGMSPVEQVVVANVARYHRGATPRRKHPTFGSLDRAQRARVKRLAALLRVADGLDRGHVGAVGGVRVRWLGNSVRLYLAPARDGQSLRLELWGVSRKAELLAEVLGVPVEVVAPGGEVAARVAPDGEHA